MSTVNQIPRSSIIWMLLAQSGVMLPHMPRLSWWMVAIWLLCAAWRLAMFRGQASYPGTFIRIVLVMLGCVGIAVEFGRLGSLDIAVALLILAFSLKLIEVKERRDIFLVLYLAYFIVASSFLFSQSIMLALYQLGCVVLITAALVAMQQSHDKQSALLSWKIAFKMLLQAVPIMLVFFIVFPRFGPLWSVPSSKSSGSTGMSDSMSPGDIADLSRSSELAFRAMFEETVPSKSQLYWRATTLSFFDGRQWNTKAEALRDDDTLGWHSQKLMHKPVLSQQAKPIRYEITMEPTRQHWVYALPLASADTATSYIAKQLIVTNDLSLRAKTPYYNRSIVKLESRLDYIAEPELGAYRRYQETHLPAGFNPRARQVAENWYRDAGSPQAYMQRVLRYFTEQPFYYTLQPPALGKHSVDEFLFESKKGFCEHYASTFTFLMRAVGIPTRVVIGYQGGEENPFNRSIIVRQFDAHAWTEVWLKGRGWVRVDPTAAVAPERIEQGLEAALSDSDEFLSDNLLSPFKYRNLQWLSWARLRLDAVNYAWYKWVVNFDTDRQMQVLKRLLGDITPARLVIAVMLVMCSVLGLVALSLLRHRVSVEVTPETRLYWQFCKRLEKVGVYPANGEAPGDFARRVTTQYPHLAPQVNAISNQYQAIVYAGNSHPHAVKQLKRAVSKFRPKKNGKHKQRLPASVSST